MRSLSASLRCCSAHGSAPKRLRSRRSPTSSKGGPLHVLSWGGIGGEIASLARPAFSCEIRERLSRVARGERTKQLIIGNLRSYGDEVICPDGNYLQTTSCDRILQVDTQADTVTAESGVRLDVLQNRVASFGYMLPVTPGTSYLTLGGAIANDVHGKNHHRAGTFGCFVLRLELVRTSGEVLLCSPSENPEFFAGTIGGMGLTGAITWAMIQLRRGRPAPPSGTSPR